MLRFPDPAAHHILNGRQAELRLEHMDHVAGRNVKPIGQLGQRKLLGKAQVQMLQYLGCKRECGIRRTQLEAMRHRRHLHQQRLQKRCPGGSRGLFRVEQQQKHPCRCSL